MTDTPVDYQNATITEVALDENHLVALVNLSAIDRLVLVDLSNGEQRILGDPVFPVAAPSIGHGYVAWQHHQFLISNNPMEMYLDWEVNYHDIVMNQSYQLNAEDEIDQLQPQVMEDHIAWLQVDEDNETEIRVFTLEVVLEPYSSNTLQLFILLLPLLLITWTAQRLKENEGTILSARRNSKDYPEKPQVDVSVIIPYHKDRGYLSEAIESYEKQIFSGTSELILSHGPEKSLGGNFNEGIRKANGKYVKILPDDDLLTPNCLQDLFDAACEYEADLVFAQARNFAGKGVEKISKSPVVNDMTLQSLIDNNFIHAITTLYRTEMLLQLQGFDISMWTAEEYEFHLRCLASGYKPHFVPSIVCEYREWEGSKSRVYRLQRKQERLDYIEQIRGKFRNQVDAAEEE
jgi:hypothetical protein